MTRGPMQTNYALHGAGDAPLVVLIHGLGLRAALWDQTVAALQADFRVLTYDLLGHGQTPYSGPPSLTLFARQLAEMLDHIGAQETAIVGFSLGGMIARRFVQDYPDRTRALAILHSPHRRTPEAQAAIKARVAHSASDGPAATVEDALQRWFTDDFRHQNPAVMDLVRTWVLANDRASYPQSYAVFADGVDQVVAPDPPIACPALVMTGDLDHGNSPDMARAIAAEIAGSRLHILPGLRHMALMQAPALTNDPLLRFLRETLHP